MDVYIWLGVMVALLVLEAACPFHLISIWFAAGALVAAIVGLCHGAVWLQFLLFALVSATLLITLLPFTKKFLKPGVVKTNIDSVIGSRGYITADVDNMAAVGRVKLGGMEWTARSTNEKPIPAGTLVRVDRIEGVKAFVSPVTADENSPV